jgi:cytidylate kinase
MIITIDGPSASGKSTIARLLSQELDFFYLNTGMLYRAFAYAVLHPQINPQHITEADVIEIITHLEYHYQQGNARVLLHNSDITALLENKTIDQAASQISALPIVRKHIDAWQHALVGGHNSVIDGRDSGSVVFAHAEHKFYVTASDEVRAQRWLAKQHEQGNEFDFVYALEQIQSRDRRDMERATAPLVVPVGATVIMNEGNDPAAVVEQIRQLCGCA